jgi:hypothetical protein
VEDSASDLILKQRGVGTRGDEEAAGTGPRVRGVLPDPGQRHASARQREAGQTVREAPVLQEHSALGT